jgi:four helix bundle protein
MKSFKELLVWQKSISLTEKIYKILLGFPKNEQYNITDQIKRCSISIPSNIAE